MSAHTAPRVLMCPPTHFAVDYEINPWMAGQLGSADVSRAARQWQDLHALVSDVATVELIDPMSGLPDMVYAANAGLIINGAAIVARFKHAERAGEATAYAAWMGGRGHQAVATHHVNEGQGDLLVVGTMILAGTGFRTDPRAHDEVEAMTGVDGQPACGIVHGLNQPL